MVPLERQHEDYPEKTSPDRPFARFTEGPTDRMPEDLQSEQVPLDLIEEASMESFPCSDPPSYTRCHA